MIRSPAFIREEEEVDVVSQNIVASSQASSTMVMVAGLPQSQSWHSLSSFTLPSRSKTKKEQRHHEQQTSHNRTPSASSSRSNSGKSSGYSSTISTPGHYLNVRPAMSKSNGSSPVASASAHACRRCGNLLCKWRKTHHNVVVCGAGGVGKSGESSELDFIVCYCNDAIFCLHGGPKLPQSQMKSIFCKAPGPYRLQSSSGME